MTRRTAKDFREASIDAAGYVDFGAGKTTEPDNETLRSLGAFDRKCRVGKHQATNWVHLRQTIDALDAAGMSDAADTLIWVVWHEVNGTARAREYHGIETQRRTDLERALAAERETAILNAEGHAREIRQLQDMVEAEVEARREAEGECERLREALSLSKITIEHMAERINGPAF